MLRIKGGWWRHTDYILQNGYILPAPGTELVSYDVWDGYREEAQDARREPDAPYVELAALSQGTDADIRRWCQTYGLLGLLPHELIGVDFADGRAWARNGNSWSATNVVLVPPGRPLHPDEFRREGLVRFLGRPYAQSIEEGLLPFFPGLPETEPIPVPPLTDTFWQWYGEPVDQIRSYARIFHRILNSFTPPTPDSPTAHWDAWGMRKGWMKWLGDHGELRPNGDGDFPWKVERGGIRTAETDDIAPVLASPNLISSLAVMCWQDLAGGARAGICKKKGCGKAFVTRRDSREYCGGKCENTAAKERSRTRNKARELHQNGVPVEEIAEKLGITVQKVLKCLE